MSSTGGWRRQVDELMAQQHGIVSLAQAAELGAPLRTMHHDVERGRLATVFPGVFRSLACPQTPEQLMAAACVRHPGVAVAFVTASRSWAFRRLPPDRRLHLIAPHGCSTTMPGVVLHRCRRIDPVDIVQRDDGIRLTSPPRTLFDVADVVGFDAASSILEQLIDDGRGSFQVHLDTFVRLARPRRPGTRTMAAVLRSRPPWREALQSDLEARVLDEIRRQRLPMPTPQWEVPLPDGRRIRIDFAWPDRRVALEVDHPFWHAGAR